jgi:transcriptional regulator with XRE-family HTH domain
MIGERLRQLRKARNLTQVQLAKASGVAQNYISELESEVAHNPSREKIARLARALEVAEAELLAPLVRHPTGSAAGSDPSPARPIRDHEYKGYRVMVQRADGVSYSDQLVVEVDGHPLPAQYWSGAEVEWGYPGAGPQALAYDLLAYEYSDALARNHLAEFAGEIIAHFPREVSDHPGHQHEWTLTGAALHDWLQQQGRPERIQVFVPASGWIAQPDGPPQMTVYTQFLPDRRLVLDLERKASGTRYIPVVQSVIEQELRPDPAPWLVWHDVREVGKEEYYLLPG